jgi:hypothetical protein
MANALRVGDHLLERLVASSDAVPAGQDHHTRVKVLS